MQESEKFKEHFLEYWGYVKNVIGNDGWVYSKQVPHLLDYYFEQNTGKDIVFEKSYEGEWKGSRWMPKSLKDSFALISEK